MDQTIQAKMLVAAKLAMERAYAPYSQFHVGVCVLGDDGQLYSGGNVENVSYPVGNCAEASALSAMVNAGVRRFQAVLIVNATDRACSPCGACRQRLREFALPDTPIILASSTHGIEKTYTLEQLLPDAFGPEHLGG